MIEYTVPRPRCFCGRRESKSPLYCARCLRRVQQQFGDAIVAREIPRADSDLATLGRTLDPVRDGASIPDRIAALLTVRGPMQSSREIADALGERRNSVATALAANRDRFAFRELQWVLLST